jgi:hypothetical protein
MAGASLLPGGGGGGVAWAAQYGAGVEVRLLDSPTADLHSGGSPVSAFAANAGGPANTHAAPSASATTNAGGVHLTAVATAQVISTGAAVTVYSSAEARGGFSDRFVISAPGLAAGSAGTATVALVLSGAPGNSGSPATVPEGQGWGTASSWTARFSLFANADGVTWEGRRSYNVEPAGSSTEGDATFGTLAFALPIVFGAPLDVSLSGVVEARAGASSVIPGNAAVLDAVAAMNLGNTIAWGGIIDLRDAGGAAVTNFDAISADTSFDYAHAYVVPEPAAGVLLLAACLGAPGLVTRRTRKSA